MSRLPWPLMSALLIGCTTSETVAPAGSSSPPPLAQPQRPTPDPVDPVCTNPPPTEAPATAFREEAVREAVEDLIRWRLGETALREANAAPAALMASFHQGLPRPIACPGGRWAYAPPAVSAAVRTADGWVRWRGEAREGYAPAVSAEIDRILADPAFWREPAFDRPTCTDAGAQRLIARSGTHGAVRQQSCSGGGLTRRLHQLVINGG